MRILVAPSEFKGTLTAEQAAEAIARGLGAARPAWEVERAPIADGGPGTLEALSAQGVVRPVQSDVEDALGHRVKAAFGLSGDGWALVEMAQASGLWRIPAEALRALQASTFGTGQLMRAALERGVTRVEVGAGGSATTDGGAGALSALGVRFLDQAGAPLERGGGALRRLARVDASGLDPRWREVAVRVWVDVQAPLEDAARVYAAQKGAGPEETSALEAGLRRFAEVAAAHTGRDLSSTPGAGAAGGLAFGLAAFLGARLVPGFAEVARVLDLEERIGRADRVLTGEGRLDAQTPQGKGPAALAALAQRAGRKVVCFTGAVGDERARTLFDEVIATGGPVPSSTEEAARILEAAARAWAERGRSGR